MSGRVYLVGAGPGDPGLITVRGLECLRRADLVLYDGLVNPLLLSHTSGRCERTCRAGHDREQMVSQVELNARLIAAAQAGLTVVRLKGGDPFVFGRGSEEAAALAEVGIPFEVVPGVTAAVAASAYAGMSLTQRGSASAVAFVTGHEDPTKERSALDYDSLARFPGTLVFYMGLHRVRPIAEALIAAGKPADTPAAVVCRATTPAQRTVTATLNSLAEAVERGQLHAPSIIVIGECVRQRERIAWFEHRPLFGLRIAITRPIQQAGPQVTRLVELGAQPILLPTIRVEPVADWTLVDEAIARLSGYHWLIFTSVNGVRGLLDRLWSLGGDTRQLSRIKLAAIGEGTAAALEEYRLRADVVPETFRAEALAEALAVRVQGRRVLWAKASRGRDVLPQKLRAVGAALDELVVYQNLDVEDFSAAEKLALESGEVDWVCLSSPSIARNFTRLLPDAARQRLGTDLRIASISPVTTAAALESGLHVNAEAETYTWEGLFAAIAKSK